MGTDDTTYIFTSVRMRVAVILAAVISCAFAASLEKRESPKILACQASIQTDGATACHACCAESFPSGLIGAVEKLTCNAACDAITGVKDVGQAAGGILGGLLG